MELAETLDLNEKALERAMRDAGVMSKRRGAKGSAIWSLGKHDKGGS